MTDFHVGCGSGLPGFAYRDVGIVVLSEPVPTSVVGTYGQLPEPGLVEMATACSSAVMLAANPSRTG